MHLRLLHGRSNGWGCGYRRRHYFNTAFYLNGYDYRSFAGHKLVHRIDLINFSHWTVFVHGSAQHPLCSDYWRILNNRILFRTEVDQKDYFDDEKKILYHLCPLFCVVLLCSNITIEIHINMKLIYQKTKIYTL
jgi:hypothetical protein